MDVWERLAYSAANLMAEHLAVAQEVGGAGEDAAWRGLMRGILSAATDELDGDRDAALGALAQALAEVARCPA